MDVVLEMLNRWVYDIKGRLELHLDSLRDAYDPDDQEATKQVQDETGQILDWLRPPLPPLSPKERLQVVMAITGDGTLSYEERLADLQRAARATGRKKGRPRDETSQHAIRALTLRLATGLSWREIALEVRGCKHKRPRPERSCVPCGEAIRNAATRLQTFLESLGYDLDGLKEEQTPESRAVSTDFWQKKWKSIDQTL